MSPPTFAEYLEAGGDPPTADEVFEFLKEIQPHHITVCDYFRDEQLHSDPESRPIRSRRFGEGPPPFWWAPDGHRHDELPAIAVAPGFWKWSDLKLRTDPQAENAQAMVVEELQSALVHRFGFEWITQGEWNGRHHALDQRDRAAESARRRAAEEAAREIETDDNDDEPPPRATMPTGPAPTVGRTWRNIFPACVTRAAEVGLSHKDVVVLGVLLSFQNTKKDDPKYLQMYPGITRLCNAMGKTTAKEINSYKPSVFRSIEALKASGALVEVRAPRKNQTSGHYKLGWPLDSWHPVTVDAPSTVEGG